MDILQQMMLEYAAMKSEQDAIAAERDALEAERVYLTKMIELIEKVISCKEAGLSFEALEKAEMYLSEQAYRMELAEEDRIEMGVEHADGTPITDEEVGNEKLYAGDVSLYPQLRKEV